MTLEELKQQYLSMTPGKEASFIKGIQSAYKDGNVNKSLLLSYLEQILEDFKPEGRRICSSCRNLSEEDRSELLVHTKIAGAVMIMKQASRSFTSLRETALLFLAYASTSAKSNGTVLSLFIDTLSYKLIDTGLEWGLLRDAISMDILCLGFEKKFRFDKTAPVYFRIDGNGLFQCSGGSLRICSSDVGESGDVAFSICDDRLEVVTRNVRDEKLKYSEKDSARGLALFADSFIKSQKEYRPAKGNNSSLKVGDSVDVRITGFDEATIYCEPIGFEQEYEGRLLEEELVKGIYTSDLIQYFCNDDIICGAVVERIDGKEVFFSIYDSYVSFAEQKADYVFKNNFVFEAFIIDVQKELYGGRVVWMAPWGFGGLSIPEPEKVYNIGDKKVMAVQNIQHKGRAVFINLSSPKYGYESVNSSFEEDYVLSDFVLFKEEYAKRIADRKEVNISDEHRDSIALLASMLANSSAFEQNLDSYRRGLASLFLFSLLGDVDSFDSLAPEMYYLRCCISFAQGDMMPFGKNIALPEDRKAVLDLLSMWHSDGDDLLKYVASLPADSVQKQVGALILGVRLSSRFSDEISVDAESVRKTICSFLGVESMFVQKSSLRMGKYGKTEGQEVEFKSSYVYRNDSKGADIDYQGRGQVFEAVCGFLNAEGGTLFLGVKDNGDPITDEDYGLKADIKWLRSNYQTLNANRLKLLGHPVCEVKDYDSYVQFLNSEKELYFNESLLENIRIEVTGDADAIRITVEPAQYEIAYLYHNKEHKDGLAFVRDGGRTVVMTRTMKERRMASLKRIGKEMGFIITIKEAIDNNKKLVFKGYSSGSSGQAEDRHVVPVNLFYNDENVYCYDLDHRDYKQFRLHRISSIEPLSGTFSIVRKEPKTVDVFRWLDEGRKKYHIRLRMDVGAKNYLLEEYSCAESLPVTELYEEKKNKWILDTYLNGLVAVRRFYLGLADKIEILDTEDSEALKADISKFVKEKIKLDK